MRWILAIMFLNAGLGLRAQTDSVKNRSGRYELPTVSEFDTVIHHYGYSFLYSEIHEQAVWVAYQLTSTELNGPFDRTDNFIEDPLVLTGTATVDDYRGSGYDRGHLAPAADMAWSDTAMYESFYFSNMSPQPPGFNRGIWKRLEEQVRMWAAAFDTIYVVTGPALKDSLPTIGENRVAVPQHYYKALLYHSDTLTTSIAFWIPAKSSSDLLQNFVVSVDALEDSLSLDFFPVLPDSLERVVEAKLDAEFWFSQDADVEKESQPSPQQVESRRCEGVTKSGKRCKRMTSSSSGFCYQHE